MGSDEKARFTVGGGGPYRDLGRRVDNKKLYHNAQRKRIRYDACVQALQFELDLFWKRSLFFWGFIGVAFIAFAAAKDQLGLQAAIASFGFVCSMVWTLANRGGKFWFENWEQKLVKAESALTGNLYGNPEIQGWKPGDNLRLLECVGWWAFKARRYSPSRLAIALSDYVFFLWSCLLASRVYLINSPPSPWYSVELRNKVALIFVVLSFLFGALLPWFCYSSATVIERIQPTKFKGETNSEVSKSTTSRSGGYKEFD